MLKIDELSAGYGKTRVVDGINIEISPGEVVALLGRNGMGKTTLLRGIFGLCVRFSGSLELEGAPLRGTKPEVLARRGLSFMPDDRGVFPELTIEENLRLATRRDYTPSVEVTELFPLLKQRPKQLAGSLSGGQKQQLGLARAILSGSKMIAIDEFSQGLQPSIAKGAMVALRQLAQDGVSVVIVEQGPQIPMDYADRILGMSKGEIVLDEPVEQLREHPDSLTNLLVIN